MGVRPCEPASAESDPPRPLRYLSVCSGIEAATAAWHSLGWTPVAFAEIEKFPSAVLAHHYPHVPNLGDFTKIEASDVGPIDLLVGGTPCQSFSVAGKRLGLDDPRGNLALEFCRLARRLRPRWIVWENVPNGVHSSWSGAPDSEAVGGDGWVGDEDSDFGAFLDALEECGYSACWRVMDAQFVRVESHPHAVPQRRERVFVVGYLGNWRPPAAVLLEPEGMRRDTPPRREARQAVAGSLGAGSKRSGQRVGRREAAANHLVAGTLGARSADHPSGIKSEADFLVVADLRNGTLDDVAQTMQSGGANGERGLSINSVPHAFGLIGNGEYADRPATLRAAGGDAGGGSEHLLAFGGNDTRGPIEVATARNGHAGPHGRLDFETETFVAHALRADGFDASEDGTGRGTPIIPVETKAFTVSAQANGFAWLSDAHPAIQAHPCSETSQRQVGVLQAIAFDTFNQTLGDIAHTLRDGHGADALPAIAFHARQDPDSGPVTHPLDTNGYSIGIQHVWAVRRLTPTECELLQGFPTGFTAITYRGKPAADGPRYKALGNSMAVNVMAWIGARIEAFEAVKRALNLDGRSEAA